MNSKLVQRMNDMEEDIEYIYTHYAPQGNKLRFYLSHVARLLHMLRCDVLLARCDTYNANERFARLKKEYGCYLNIHT